MVFGIGTDLIEVERIQAAIKRKGFLERYFTDQERAYFKRRKMNCQVIAGNFAVKEAVVKAFATGFGQIKPNQIEVLRNTAGAPYIQLYAEALTYAKNNQIDRLHVSIANIKAIAIGYVVAETNCKDNGTSFEEIMDWRRR